jgi:hypothetical protein
MAAISDYLESELLNFLFRGSNSFMGHTMAQNPDKDNVPYGKPLNLSIALTGRPPQDNDTGATIDEIPVNVDVGGVSRATNYKRYDLGSPSEIGDNNWLPVGSDGTNDSLAQAYSVHSARASKTFVPPGNSTPTTVLIGDGSTKGYYYPLFLSQGAVTGANTIVTYNFVDQPGINFYGAYSTGSDSNFYENQEINPDPTDILIRLYEDNGFIKNKISLKFNKAVSNWGFVSGIAILDSPNYGEGNLLMHAQLKNPRQVTPGDSLYFDPKTLEISLK